MRRLQLFIIMAAFVALASCSKKDGQGRLSVQIHYLVNGQELACDSLRYTNQAGNQYLVNEIQWFISDIALIDDKGNVTAFNASKNVFYIDSDIPETQSLASADIPVGYYKAIRFTLGLNDAENQSGRFVNPPESNMFWPDPIGGGYHHIKLNGKWLDTLNQLLPFCMHIGKGPDGDHFVSNFFDVEIPAGILMKEGETTAIDLNMNINNWFCNPNTFDFNHWGGSIMQNQAAQQALKENGHDVFTIGAHSCCEKR